MRLLFLLLLLVGHVCQAQDADPFAPVIKDLTAKVANGDPEAMERLAFYYENGLGVLENSDKAFELHAKAANAGSVAAMESLGGIYGKREQHHESFRWYEKAAKGGSMFAMFRLGVSYQKGWGVAPDPQKARQLLERSATGGVDMAQMYVGSLYYSGELFPKNEKMAYAWLSIAASNNSQHARMRDAVGETLSPEDLREAKDLSLSLLAPSKSAL